MDAAEHSDFEDVAMRSCLFTACVLDASISCISQLSLQEPWPLPRCLERSQPPVRPGLMSFSFLSLCGADEANGASRR